MAGKHVGGIQNASFGRPGSTAQLAAFPPVFPGTPADRAYSEGRQEGIRLNTPTPPNPFPSTQLDEFRAWNLGGFFQNTEASDTAVQSHVWKNPAEPNP